MADCLFSCHTQVPFRTLDVLCCAALCCAVLCSAVLCSAVLCCAVLCCAVLCCAVLACPYVYVICRLPLGLHMHNHTVCWGHSRCEMHI